jgi:DNA-binding NtrC family response regulator
MNKAAIAIPEDCLEILHRYDWPGNVRELANCLERAVILCDGSELRPEHFGLDGSAPRLPKGFDLTGSLADVGRRAAAIAEREKIEVALEEVKGDRTRAAELLEVSGKTLLHKMREYGFVPTGGSREAVSPDVSLSISNDDPTEAEGGAEARPPTSRTGSKNDV